MKTPVQEFQFFKIQIYKHIYLIKLFSLWFLLLINIKKYNYLI